MLRVRSIPTPSRAMMIRGLGISLLFTLTSCFEENDPSYEKEVLRLTAENAVLETKLEAAEKKNNTLEKQIATLQKKQSLAKSDAASKKLKELEAARIKRDAEFQKLSQEIAQLKQQAEKAKQTQVATPTQASNTQAAPTSTIQSPARIKDPNTRQIVWPEGKRPTGSSSQSTNNNPAPPTQKTQAPSKRKTIKRQDPNTHQIDWSKAK